MAAYRITTMERISMRCMPGPRNPINVLTSPYNGNYTLCRKRKVTYFSLSFYWRYGNFIMPTVVQCRSSNFIVVKIYLSKLCLKLFTSRDKSGSGYPFVWFNDSRLLSKLHQEPASSVENLQPLTKPIVITSWRYLHWFL